MFESYCVRHIIEVRGEKKGDEDTLVLVRTDQIHFILHLWWSVMRTVGLYWYDRDLDEWKEIGYSLQVLPKLCPGCLIWNLFSQVSAWGEEGVEREFCQWNTQLGTGDGRACKYSFTSRTAPSPWPSNGSTVLVICLGSSGIFKEKTKLFLMVPEWVPERLQFKATWLKVSFFKALNSVYKNRCWTYGTT